MTYYSPKQVARAIGVSEASLKRWCDRGLIAFVKTPGGHRRIPRQEVIGFIRNNEHDLVAPEILDLPRGTRKLDRGPMDMRTVYELLMRGDERTLRSSLVGAYLAGDAIHPFWDRVLAPAFHRIGEAWASAKIEIYQERLACEICTRLLYEAVELFPEPAPDAPLGLGASLSRDPYTLPSLMVEATLRELGWRSRSLGANLPGATLEKAIFEMRPRMFWLSVTAIDEEDLFHEDYQRVWKACSAVGTILAVGGRGLTDQRRSEVDYTVFCDHLSDLVNFLDSVG